MGKVDLPSTLTLPSRITIAIRASDAPKAPSERTSGDALFEATRTLLASGAITLTKGGAAIDVDGLALADFHALRAVLTKAGFVAEEAIDISCRNCGAAMKVHPCEAMEIGPFVDDELDDPELDATLAFGDAHDIEPVSLGRVRTASTVTLAPRTVAEAMPLFSALAKSSFDIDASVVGAMGIEALGPERDPEVIAEALATCGDDAFTSIVDVFLASHYPPRLGALVFCGTCNARNDIDAPYDREFALGARRPHAENAGTVAEFPSFDAFAARANAIARPLVTRIPGEQVELIVEDDTPAVDDGGEPLLGSYVPPHPGDHHAPSRSPSVTVYYRTFRAMWEEDGPYDWEDELAETIEHELEHHDYFLRGDDPMDDEERAEIRREATRVVGRREAERRALEGFGASVTDFLERTWPLWLLVLLALVITLATQR